MFRTIAVIAAAFGVGSSALGAGVGTTETFDSSAADWWNATNTGVVDWSATGGFDGAGHVSTTFNFTSSVIGDTPVLFRAQDEHGSSGGAFEGDYIASGVTGMSFWVRHDGPAPINVFARFSGAMNFPGAVALSFAPVFSGVWTEVTLSIAEGNPALILEGSDYASVFSNVGHVQIGVSVGDSLAGYTPDVRFDLDHVQLIPAPGAAAVLGCGLVGALRRRR